MPSTIGKSKLFRIKHITLLEGETFLRNKHDIAFFEIKCTFFGREENTIRLITSAPWFISNNCIRKDLNVLSVREEIKRFSEKYLQRLSDHINPLAVALLDDGTETRRLKRAHILDLSFRS